MALILASKSPRRRELLAQMGLTDFEIHPALGEELAQPDLTPPELVQALALHKAQEVAQAFAQSGDVVIGADTIVVLDGQVLGKPHDEAHALAMLTALSGREHHVYTGVGGWCRWRTRQFGSGTPPKESCGGTSPPANPWTRQVLTASKAEAACWCPASKGTTPTWWVCPSCA